MEVQWSVPRKGLFKVNVHGCYTDQPFTNGNKSGIGAVIRNDQGKVIKMLTGTEAGLTEKRNMLFAMLMGLRLAWEEDIEDIILETDNWFAYQALNGKYSETEKYELQQLENRKKNNRVKIEAQYIPASANRLATYLAQNGGETREDIHVTTKPFGKVLEIWHEDQGLGPQNIRFINEEEIQDADEWKGRAISGKRFFAQIEKMEDDGESHNPKSKHSRNI